MATTNKDNTNTNTAAAMDALNIDDLFRDDPNDSFFDEMDMDLGDISGVFNEGGDVLSTEFGRGGSFGGGPAANAVEIQKNDPQSMGKKRGSKIALTHAQIMASLGIKEEEPKKQKPAAPPPPAVDEDDGTTMAERIRSRRDARSNEVDATTAKNGPFVIASPKNEHNPNQMKKLEAGNHEITITNKAQTALNAVSNFGMGPSMDFFPYVRMPHQVEIKRTQKAFPCMERINAASTASENNPTDHSPESSRVLHQLCSMHAGSIKESTADIAASANEAKKYLNQAHLPMLKEELSKLLIGVMKQSAFLRQNLMNMETYALKNMEEAEFKSTFPVRRKEVESAVTLIHSDGIESLLSSPSGKKEKDKPSTKGIDQLNLKPTVTLKVKVRVPGWRDKSGRKLVGRLEPPKEWTVAFERAKILARKRREEAAADKVKKSVKPVVLEAAAAEVLQSHVLLQLKESQEKKTTLPAAETQTAKKKAPPRKRKSSTVSTTSNSTKKRTTPVPKAATPAPSLDNEQQSLTRAQQLRLIQVLKTNILHPLLSPTERRTMLSNEISSTIERFESAQTSKQMAKAKEIQNEIAALEEIYKKDFEIMHEANIVGLWKWLESTGHFKEIKEEDICDALESALDATSNVGDSIDGGKLWGVMVPPANVKTKAQNENPNEIEQSPLFDCLQSLLVEVDGSDEFGDDELLANLPPYTKDQILNGPDYTESSNDEVLDVSQLSLDQRTYLQLRAAGLISVSAIPPETTCGFAGKDSSSLVTISVDSVIEKMKSDLSKLQSINSSASSELQSAALSHLAESSKQQKLTHEQESILAKYHKLKKEKNELSEKRRISNRVKNGPAKFDGTN